MNTIKMYDFIDSARPYLDIETKLLNQIRVGILKLIEEAKANHDGISTFIRVATYQNQVMDIDRELAMRN